MLTGVSLPQRRVVVGLLLLSVSPLFFFCGPDYDSPRSFQALWNLGHILFFAVFSYLFFISGWFSTTGFGRRLVLLLMIVLMVGGGVELIQAKVGRDSDVADMFNNWLGVLLVAAWWPIASRVGRKSLWLLRLMVAGLLAVAIYSPASMWLDEWRAAKAFPRLADFESGLEVGRFHWEGVPLSRSARQVSEGRFALKAILGTERYSGIALQYFPGDWRGYKTLRFDLYNASDTPLWLTVRIHDHWHSDYNQHYNDRFNQRFLLQPGWNAIDVALEAVKSGPLTRQLDMSAIAGLAWFVSGQVHPKTLYLDNVRLQ